MTLSAVDLPAPLAPMSPRLDPAGTRRSTSRSAQRSSHCPKRRWIATSLSERYFSRYTR